MINIKSIWEAQTPTGDIIIKTRIDDIPHLNCYAATNNITGQILYLMSVSKNVSIPELKNFKFKGVEIFTIDLEESIEFYIYLLESDLKDIFSLFVENILDDIKEKITESEAIDKTLNIIFKWKKLFDKISFNGLSTEAQKGLIGELLFINFLLDHGVELSKVLSAWKGPDYDDKDFIFGPIGSEIKFTSSKIPKLKITNERQLDTQNISKLYLILYTTEEVKDNGFSLNSMIQQTRSKFEINHENLNLFNERLLLIGYLEDDYEYYNKMYSIRKAYYFNVSKEFPRIVESQLALGIYNTSYFIELSAVEEFIVEKEEILSAI